MKKALTFILSASICAVMTGCGAAGNGGSSAGTVSQSTVTEAPAQTKFADVAVGDMIKTDFAEMTIDEAGIKPDLKTSIKTGNVTRTSGAGEEAGYQYAYIRGTVKNVSKSELSWADIAGEAKLDGYSYSAESVSIIESNGNSVSKLAPLITYSYTLYAKIPDSLAAAYQSGTISFGFDDDFKSSFNKLDQRKYAYTLTLK